MNEITINDVSKMTNIEGLVLQGCGGDPQEWIDGINKLLTEQGILLKGDTFKEVSCFKHDGLTNLIFHIDSVELDLGILRYGGFKPMNSLAGCGYRTIYTIVWESSLIRNWKRKSRIAQLLVQTGISST